MGIDTQWTTHYKLYDFLALNIIQECVQYVGENLLYSVPAKINPVFRNTFGHYPLFYDLNTESFTNTTCIKVLYCDDES